MKIKLIFVLLILLTLSSCGYTEPGGEYMITTLGLGETQGGFEVILQAVDIKKGEQGGLPDTFIVKGQGQNTAAAYLSAERGMSKPASLDHLELILLEDNVGRSGVEQITRLCKERDVTLSAKLAVCGNAEALLKSDSPSAGTQLLSLLKQNYRLTGFGGHTAVYEISTALLTAEGRFALPYIEKVPKIEGMLLYIDGTPNRRLNYADSVKFAKEISGGRAEDE